MNRYNNKHNTLIEFYFLPQYVKVGEKVPHNPKVNSLSLFRYDGNGEYDKIVLTREFIMDMAEEIKKIEAEIEYMDISDDFPF